MERKALSAFPGMTIDQAVDLIHRRGAPWYDAPERGVLKNPHGNGRGRSPLENTRSTMRPLLEQTMRDCAWCISHSGGDLHKLFDAVLKGTKEPYRYDISRVMDHAFHGIAGWMA